MRSTVLIIVLAVIMLVRATEGLTEQLAMTRLQVRLTVSPKMSCRPNVYLILILSMFNRVSFKTHWVFKQDGPIVTQEAHQNIKHGLRDQNTEVVF